LLENIPSDLEFALFLPHNNEESAMAIRILLADDHKIVREGLRKLIREERNMEVVAEAENGHQAIDLAGQHDPDVVVMDVSMPDLNGFEATRQITAQFPKVRVIALSMHSEKPFVGEMLNAGAMGYLVKDCAFEELAEAIRSVKAGKNYLSSVITDIVVDGYVSKMDHLGSRGLACLSNREKEVLQLLAEGKSTKETAYTLKLSVKTVETHRQRIMSKLNIHSVAGLTKWALRSGITSL
jgi:DNA-binding NarL/FixJ family response regulator